MFQNFKNLGTPDSNKQSDIDSVVTEKFYVDTVYITITSLTIIIIGNGTFTESLSQKFKNKIIISWIPGATLFSLNQSGDVSRLEVVYF